MGRQLIQRDYVMNGVRLETVEEEKDLGVIIRSDLKASSQCTQAYLKANRMLGVMNRTIQYKSREVMLSLYKTLVRPLLEFSTAAWSPHYVKDRVQLERIQRRFTRMIPELKEMTYEKRLAQLGLWTLKERKKKIVQIYWRYLRCTARGLHPDTV